MAKFKVGDKVVYRKFGGSPQIVKEVFIAPKDIKKIADVFGRYWDEDKEKEILSKPGEWLAFGPFDVQEGKLYEKSVGEWITPATDQNALSKINGYYGRKEKIEGLTATVIPKVLETSGGAMVSVLLRVSDNDMLTAKQNSSLVSRCKAIAQEIEKIIVGLGYKKTSATNISFQGANSPYIQLYFKGKTIANSVRSTNSVVAKALNSKVAMNSVDAKDKEEMAKFFKEMKDVISEISRLDMEFASYEKGLLNKAAKTQDKELTDWVQKADYEWKKLKVAGKIKS